MQRTRKRPKKKPLTAMTINESLGDVATHFMKSGSSFRPKDDLDGLANLKRKLELKTNEGIDWEYDLWFNTNELHSIRKWLYTDFLGKGIYCRVNSVKINTKLFKSITNSDIKIDEERIDKIKNNLQNKYTLQWNTEFHDKVIFPPGSNLLCKGTVIDYNRVGKLVNEGYKIKPHPITAPIYIADLKRRFGAANVLNKKEGGYELLLNSSEVATAPNSEMGLIAILLRKKLSLVSFPKVAREKNLLTYESFYDTISNRDSYLALRKIFSAKNSGIIFDFDEDAEERLQAYINNFWEFKKIKKHD
jgi:hypothetical protein